MAQYYSQKGCGQHKDLERNTIVDRNTGLWVHFRNE